MIALVVQIFAPIAACWAAAIVASDPLGRAVICHESGGAAGQQGDQGIPQHEHGAACTLCCLAGASAGLDTPRPIVLANPYRDVAPVAWSEHRFEALASRTGSNARARAPPFAS